MIYGIETRMIAAIISKSGASNLFPATTSGAIYKLVLFYYNISEPGTYPHKLNNVTK